MHQWFSLKVGDLRPRTFILPPKFRAAGLIMNDCVVTISRYRPAGNTTAGIELVGSRLILVADSTIDGIAVLAGQAVTQEVRGLVASIVDVVTFTCALSDGTPYIEDVVQPCSAFVPP